MSATSKKEEGKLLALLLLPLFFPSLYCTPIPLPLSFYLHPFTPIPLPLTPSRPPIPPPPHLKKAYTMHASINPSIHPSIHRSIHQSSKIIRAIDPDIFQFGEVLEMERTVLVCVEGLDMEKKEEVSKIITTDALFGLIRTKLLSGG